MTLACYGGSGGGMDEQGDEDERRRAGAQVEKERAGGGSFGGFPRAMSNSADLGAASTSAECEPDQGPLLEYNAHWPHGPVFPLGTVCAMVDERPDQMHVLAVNDWLAKAFSLLPKNFLRSLPYPYNCITVIPARRDALRRLAETCKVPTQVHILSKTLHNQI